MCLHRPVLSRVFALFFAFCLLEEVYLVVHGDRVILGLIIFYVINCY